MTSNDEVQVQFEDAQEEDLQIVQLDSDELPVEEKQAEPEGVMLTKEEHAELLRSRDSTGQLTQGLSKLAEVMQPRPNPYQQPVMPVDDFDPMKLEEDAYKPGKFTETVQKISQRTANQVSAQMAPLIQAQSKRILQLDPQTGPIYKRFEKEIEERVAQAPMHIRIMPNVYEMAYEQITKERSGDLVEERAKAMARDMMKEMGIDPETYQKKPAPAMYSESSPSATARPAPKKTTLTLTKSDAQDMLESGMNPRDVDQVRSYLDDKKRRSGK